VTHLADAFTTASNGRQELTNGLRVHKGVFDTSLLRATNNVTVPRSGAGTEISFDPKGAQFGAIQAYDRDAGAYRDLYVVGKNVTVQANGGKATLPAGTAQQLLGQYYTASAWATSAPNTWQESPIQTPTFTSTGGVLRIEAHGSIVGSVLGSVIAMGLGIDGVVTWPSIQVLWPPANNAPVAYSFHMYHSSLAAGVHRVSVFVNVNTGVATLWASSNQGLWVTEQRA
jgi:hypothetical protein